MRTFQGIVVTDAEIDKLTCKPEFIEILPGFRLFNYSCSYCRQEWTSICERSFSNCLTCGAPLTNVFRSVGAIAREIFFVKDSVL